MARLKPNEKRVQLSFQRPEDVILYEWMTKQAYTRRLTLPDFILLALGEAFAGQFDEEPTPIIERQEIVTAPIEIVVEPLPAPESADDGYESTKAKIATNNALYAKTLKRGRKASIPLPDTTPANPPVQLE